MGCAARQPISDGVSAAVGERGSLGLSPCSLLAGPPVVAELLPRARGGDSSLAGQYDFPRAKPPKAMSPIKAMISPIQKLQTIIKTIPTMTMMPPRDMPAIPPRSFAATIPPRLRLLVWRACTPPAIGTTVLTSRRSVAVRAAAAGEGLLRRPVWGLLMQPDGCGAGERARQTSQRVAVPVFDVRTCAV